MALGRTKKAQNLTDNRGRVRRTGNYSRKEKASTQASYTCSACLLHLAEFVAFVPAHKLKIARRTGVECALFSQTGKSRVCLILLLHHHATPWNMQLLYLHYTILDRANRACTSRCVCVCVRACARLLLASRLYAKARKKRRSAYMTQADAFSPSCLSVCLS